MKEFKDNEKINSSKNVLLSEIAEELHQVIKYVEINLLNVQDKEIVMRMKNRARKG